MTMLPRDTTLLELADVRQHPRLVPLLARRSALQEQQVFLVDQLKAAQADVEALEQAEGEAMALSDVVTPWKPNRQLTEAHSAVHDLETHARVVEHALLVITTDIAAATAAARAEIGHALRAAVFLVLTTLIDRLEGAQEDYSELRQLRAHGERLLGIDARYILEPELFDLRLAAHLELLQNRHNSHAEQLMRTAQS